MDQKSRASLRLRLARLRHSHARGEHEGRHVDADRLRGKTDRVHAQGPAFPCQLVSHSPTHWITQDAVLDMIDVIDADMHARAGDAELIPWLLLLDCVETTKEIIRQIFNEVLKQEDCTPETWRKIRRKVIYKKRNMEDVGNYRPICTLPALYKLFSTILLNKLYSRLDQAQPEDQGVSRRAYQMLEHLATYRLLEQKCREWSIKILGRDSGLHEGI